MDSYIQNHIIHWFFFSPCSPPRFLGHPAAKILYAYNPSRDSEVVVNSVFTAARHFHVPPVHCRVSVDVLLETMLWQAARFSCFLWPEVFTFCSLSPPFLLPKLFPSVCLLQHLFFQLFIILVALGIYMEKKHGKKSLESKQSIMFVYLIGLFHG